MAKTTLSAADLGYIVLEELRKVGVRPQGIGILPGKKPADWSIILESRTRRFMQESDMRRLAVVEKRLRSIYGLGD